MSKYSKGDKFTDEGGQFKVIEVAKDHDPFDYYVNYIGRRKPDKIGKSEADLDSATQL